MASSVYGKGINGILKRYWHEMPGVTACSIVGTIGLGLAIVDYLKIKNGPRVLKYKKDYIVVRPDDPLVNEPVRSYPY